MPSPLTRSGLLAIATAVAVAVAGCGTSSSGSAPVSTTVSAPKLIGHARCSQNQAAGTLNYLSGFEWSATVGTVDVAAAAANGWYKDLCLSVELHPGNGNPSTAAQTVASGQTAVAEVGGASDVLSAVAAGIPVEAIATYGNVPAITLITMASVTDLHQLEGKTLGYKNVMPPELTAMLQKLGVDVKKIKEVGVGYDPTVLPRGQVQALTGYKSSEVPTLRRDGYNVREWDPDAYGISGTFNSLIAAPSFAKAHPTAIEDFLRATFHAYQWCHTNVASCLANEAKLSQSGFDATAERNRWNVESGLVDGHLLAGRGVGAETTAQFQPELDLLLADKLIPKAPDLETVVAGQYVAAVESGSTVVWPAP
ncbi:ABC transporter substrate-binding protein [Acidiferrimicrobium sp. IK]|uniref:ABC transporter substrate-binding protein n=1 Tax=Acidiferrimicrobium sp. IK TaxID=2871700 RepID=UPI0021CB17CC|nr:ABC transporter substrate-binding protein [Acidiferrimicrobium sp. IK]MCU4184045.1 ABC transporter substrate-binding protein [Acidiferrimicrobium sp. IK]